MDLDGTVHGRQEVALKGHTAINNIFEAKTRNATTTVLGFGATGAVTYAVGDIRITALAST